MQYTVNFNQIAEKILNLVLNSSKPSVLLEDLALTVGRFFEVDACIAVSVRENVPQSLTIGWWGREYLTPIEDSTLQKFCGKILTNNNSTKEELTIQTHLSADLFNVTTSSMIATNFQGKANGALILIKSQTATWSDREKQQVMAISEVMAIAFSQLQLQLQLQTQTNYQNLLSRLSKTISQSSEPKLLFNLALSEIGKALKIDRAKIITVKYKDPFFIQRKRKQQIKATLTVAESWSIESNPLLPAKFAFQLTNSHWCQQALAQAPEPLVINRGVNFPDLATEFLPEEVGFVPPLALLMMPLMGKTTSESQPPLVLGFLVLQRNYLYCWNQEEIDLISWLSVQLSNNIIHHQTLNQVHSIVEERTSQLQWSVDVQTKLSKTMRQQIEQLQKLNELKDDFLSSMSHELKTPMTSMKMAIRMLRQNIPETMRVKYLDILEQEWNREYNLIKDLLTLQQVESGELAFTPQELDLNQIIDDISTSFRNKWQSEKGLILETRLPNSDLHFYSDLDSLQHILNELLLNAAKYSDADTSVHLSATTRNTFKGKEVEIMVGNHGVEIEPKELPHIFDKFRRGKGVTDRAVPGTGLGLTLVKHLVEHLNGRIEVTSEAIADSELFETTFTVTLPQQR